MSIAEMLSALGAGQLTSVDLVCASLNRIAWFDRSGLCLNAVPVLNPEALAEAEASDARRRAGQAGPLEGVPFTVKDSYMVKGLTVASGSVALKDLIAGDDAATVALLRWAGAVLIGKTNMPPMAAGGVQPGAYEYARSPYHPDYLSAAYGSGSSNGSGVATAASFAAFGMGEETVSSGRSPASNNSLVAYTPSRGLISIRGNWPLRPTCDVVVPHTRTVEDLLHLLDVLVTEDSETVGDFWRQQNAVKLPTPHEVFTEPFARPRPGLGLPARLDGMRLGVPRMYIGEDPEAAVPPAIRDSVRALWHRAAADLQSLGAEIVPVDFPLVSNYEEDRPGAEGLPQRGLVPPNWRDIEGGPLTAMALDQFLRLNGDPALSTWAEVDGDTVFPVEDAPVHVWVEMARGGFDWQRLAELVKYGLPETYDDVAGVPELLAGLERARTVDFEDWMEAENLDAVVFPAAGDVGREDLFTRPESMEEASRNGVAYSNGNRALRHLGVPTVTVPMGVMPDIKMPVGLTFAGPAYADDALLDIAAAYETETKRREKAFLTPSLPSNWIEGRAGGRAAEDAGGVAEPFTVGFESIRVQQEGPHWRITVPVTAPEGARIQVWADGHILQPLPERPEVFQGRVSASRKRVDHQLLVLIKATHGGRTAAHLEEVPLP